MSLVLTAAQMMEIALSCLANSAFKFFCRSCNLPMGEAEAAQHRDKGHEVKGEA